MMKNFTSYFFLRRLSHATVTIILLTLLGIKSYGQTKIYANALGYTSPNGATSLGCGTLGLQPCYNTPTVVNAANALTSDNSTFATLNSSGGLAVGLGSYAGEMELKFPTVLPAGTTSYVRINFNADILNQLLAGNLGSLLANVAGGVVLGNHYFEVGARNASGTTVLTGASNAGFTGDNLKLVKDANGYFYMAITPTQAYDRVFVRDVTNTLLLSTLNSMQVYYAFYTSGTDPCAQAYATSFEGNGLTVGALGLGKAGVTNPEYAIDNVPTTYSELSLGLLGVAGSISQDFYFYQPSNSGDDFNLTISAASALVTANVLNNLTVTSYSGNTQVFSQSAATLLNADLLTLLSTGNSVNIPFSPGVPFDRIKVTLSSLLNVNLDQTIRIYEVSRSAGRPTFEAPSTNALSVCYNSTATLAATTPNTNQLIWYDAITGGTALATVAYNGTFVTPALTANKTYYVAARRIGCTQESSRVPVTITVRPAIVFNTTVLANATSGSAYSKQINAATGGTPGFTYSVTSGALPAGLTLSNTGLITGTPNTPGSYTFSVTATDSQGCTATANYSLTVTAPLSLTPGNLPNGITGVLYPAQTIPPATGGTGPYSYTATSLPPGLSFNPATREITGTPTQTGTYNIPVTVTDANGNTVTAIYTVSIVAPLVLPPASLANGTTGTPYPTQIIPSATGGTAPYVYSAGSLPPGLSFNTATREITGTPTQTGNFVVPVTVTDNSGQSATTSYTINVTNPLSLPPATLADGTIGASYPTQTIPAATGGAGGYTYVATNLPPGLSFNAATREITGTPTQAGNYIVMVTVTDASGNTASNTYPLKVNGVLSLPTATLPNGVVGEVYPPQTLPAVSGGTSPYTYVANNLPPGLSFNTATREISGTPTLGGMFTISLTATDASNNTVTSQYMIQVNVNAPVVANAAVCAGSAANLTVSNVQNGVTYNLYASTGSTPIATNTTGVFTTPVINSNATFYVEAVSGTAVSSKTPVTVSLNPAANPAVITSSSQVINSGQSTVLTATADAGNTIQWFNVSTSGTALATGSSFITGPLTATTTYYVQTTNANGCVSSNRVPVTVTVIPAGGITNCNAANAQNSGITGICVLCGIANPGNSTDADPNNYTRITLAVGVGSTGYQRLIFPSAGVATDSIRLDLALPTGLLDLTVLSNITVTVLNGTTVVATYPLNSNTIGLSLLNGNRFKATVSATGIYDGVEVRIAGLAAAVTSLDVYGATVVFPNPTLTAGNQTICSGNTATLTATANGGTDLKWYDAPTGGNVLANGTTYTTPALTSTTTYYIEVSKAGCANIDRVPVTVTVTPAVALPVLAPIANACAGNTATLSVSNPDPALTYNWYNAATGGTLLFTGTSFVTPAVTAATTYYLEAANGTCLSPARVAATINVNPRPVLPSVNASASTVNPGQTAILTASSTESNVTFNWYDSATSTTPIFTGSTFVTPPLTATTSYYVEAVSNATGCSSTTRVQITVNVDPSGVPNPVPCEAAVSQVNGITGTLSVLAGVSNPNLAVDNDTQTASTLSIPVGLAASVYQRLSFGSLSHLGDTVKVMVTSPGNLLSLSLLGSAQLTSYNGLTSNNDAVNLNNNLLNVQLLSGNTSAIITFVPTAVFDAVELRLNSGLLGALTNLNLNYAQRVLKAPDVTSANVSACANQTTTLSVLNPVADLTYRWYDAAGVYLNYVGTTYTTPVLTADTKYYVAAVSASGCVSYKTVINVTTVQNPVNPELLASTVNICSASDVVLQVKNPIPGITYKWYDASNVYQTGKDGTSFTILNVTTATSYSVEAVNSCGVVSAARATANINVGTAASAPVITPAAATVVSGTPAVLTATSSISGATINWYDSPTATIPLYTGSTYTTDPLTVNTTFYAEVAAAGACPASARASVLVTVISGTPNSADCGIATTSIRNGVDGIAVGAGVTNIPGAIDNDVNTGSTLSIPAGLLNASVYHQIGFTGGLSNVGDRLTVKISSPGKLLSLAVLPNITVTTYNGATSNGDAMLLSNPLIQLQLAVDGSTATISYIPTAAFDGVELRLNSGVIGALTSVNFDYARRIIPVPTVSAGSVSACQGSSAILSVSNPQPNTTYKWYQETTFKASGITYSTDPALTAGTYNFYVTATGNNGCETAGTLVVVTITAPPAPPVPTATNPVTTCISSPVTLSVNAVAGVTYHWYDAASGGSMLVSNNNSYTTSASLTPGSYTYYVEARNSNGCSSSSRTPVSITVNQNATMADLSVTGTISVCTGATTTLTATSMVANAQFKWYSDAALTNLVHSTATFTTPAITSNTTYYVTVSGTNLCENTTGNADVVSITVNPPAVAADITVIGGTTTCAGTGVTLTASSLTVTNPIFTWYNDASLTSVAYIGTNFTSPVLTASTTYYVTVKGDNKCENSAANAKAVVILINPAANASDIAVSGATTICGNSSASLSATSTTITNPIFSWYTDAALTNKIYTGNSFTTPVLTATTTYYITVKGDNSCENTPATAKMVTITVKPFSTTADIAVNNANVCSGSSATLMASSLTVTQPVFTWYSDASLTVPVFTGPTYNIPSVTANTTLYVTVKGTNKCENSAANAKVVTISINPLSTSTDIIVAGSTNTCTGGQTVLTATSTTVVNPVFTWYSNATLTNVANVGGTFTTPALSTTTTYYVTVKGDNQCENAPGTARLVIVTVNAAPLSPVVSSTGANICGGTGTTLVIQNAQSGTTYEWYDAASGGNLVFTGTTFNTPVLNANTSYYVQAIGAAGCPNSSGRTMVTVTVNPTPANVVLTANAINVCSGTAAVFTVSNPQNGLTYNWYTAASGGTLAGTGSTFTSPILTSNVIYYVEAASASCVSGARTQATATVTASPVAPAAVTVSNTQLCAGSARLLSVTTPDPMLTYRWYSTATGGTLLAQGITFTTPVLTASTTYYVESANASGCVSSSRTAVSINVLPVLTSPVVTVQSTTSTSVTFAWNPVTGATGYEVSLNGGLNWSSPTSGPLGTTNLVTGLKPDESITIIVRANGSSACQTSANSIPVTGKASNPLGNDVYIPNVFSPNNDGKNDTFLVFGTRIANVKMNVYTQWGQLIFQTDSASNGWDGTYKGINQPTGVYVYLIDITSTDGTKQMRRGTITLIR